MNGGLEFWIVRDIGDNIMNGVGDVLHVLGGQSAHVDSARAQQVDVVLLLHDLHLTR